MDVQKRIQDMFKCIPTILFEYKIDHKESDVYSVFLVNVLKNNTKLDCTIFETKLYSYFKKNMGLKNKDELKIIFDEYNKLLYKREQIRNYQYPKFHIDKERLDDWAKRVWKKRGSPKFKKKIIDGIVFGDPILKTKQVRGPYFRQVIVKRCIGVTTDRKKISILCAG